MSTNTAGAKRPVHQSGVSAMAMYLALILFATTAQAKYGGGSGTADDPYLIYTAEQMYAVGLEPADWDKHFKLMADLDLSAYKGDSWHRIGVYSTAWPWDADWIPPFTGIFDGNGHRITNFTYVMDVRVALPDTEYWGDRYIGLFGLVDGPQAMIKDLTLIDPNVYPVDTCSQRVVHIGALAGDLRRGTITNCHVKGGRVSGDGIVGGLVGGVDGTVSNCSAACTVSTGEERVILSKPLMSEGQSIGGLIGANTGRVSDCHATGNVRGVIHVGGLVGANRQSGSADEVGLITNSYATGNVSGQKYVGGLVGENTPELAKTVSTMIRGCYATGDVSGDEFVGGLVGFNMLSKGRIETSHATGRVSGRWAIGGLEGENNGTTRDCYATGAVSGTDWIGGLVGCNAGPLQRSYATGEVTGNGERAGGLAGSNAGPVSSCYARGDVFGHTSVGGLIGLNFDPVEDCYATGQVTGNERVGGLAGEGKPENFTDSFWDVQTSGLDTSIGGAGKTTAEMQDASMYLAAGWDFVDEIDNGTDDIWQMGIDRATYPRLAWEDVSAGQDARKIIFEATLDTDPGWTMGGQWQFGPPAGAGANEHGHPDPDSGYTGANVYGVNLAGDYASSVNGPQYLIAGPFDCTGYRNVTLQFARWLNTDQADFVDAMVEVSADGVSWATVWKYAFTEGELTGDKWKVVTYDIGATADGQKQVYLRWGYEVLDKEAWPMSGWNIDDITLTGLSQ